MIKTPVPGRLRREVATVNRVERLRLADDQQLVDMLTDLGCLFCSYSGLNDCDLEDLSSCRRGVARWLESDEDLAFGRGEAWPDAEG